MPFQRLSGRLNYYITRWSPEVIELEIRWVRDKMRQRKPSSSRELGPWASGWAVLENEKDTTLIDIRVGVNMLQFCSDSNSLSHANLTIKWEVYFLEEVFSRLYSLCHYDSACICVYICICRNKIIPKIINMISTIQRLAHTQTRGTPTVYCMWNTLHY